MATNLLPCHVKNVGCYGKSDIQNTHTHFLDRFTKSEGIKDRKLMLSKNRARLHNTPFEEVSPPQ